MKAPRFNQQENMTGTDFLKISKFSSRVLPLVTQVTEARVLCRKPALLMILMKTQDLSKRRKFPFSTRLLKTMISTLY
jgi:hypothetical protein